VIGTLERFARLKRIEAREALEVKLAGVAAARRTDEEMAAIDRAIATMEAEIAD